MTDEDKKTATAEAAAQETAAPETSTEQPAEQPAPETEKPEDNLAAAAAAAMGFKTEKADEKSEKAEASSKPAEPAKPVQPDWKELYSRMAADFENYRKRMARDREDLVKFAASDVIKDMLTTVDNLALALDKAKDKADDPFVTGVKLVYDGLVKKLADHGATPLDSVGEPFDANFHEALAQLPSPTVEEGHVMNEVKRGWLLHGKLLRAAQVVVSSGKGE